LRFGGCSTPFLCQLLLLNDTKNRNQKFKTRRALEDCDAARLYALQEGIERALAISFEIDRYEDESGFFQSGGDFRGNGRIEPAGKFVLRQFEASEFSVSPHAELAKTEVAQNGFGTVNLIHQFGRHGGSVWHA
jgi:hypothetical protein